MRHIPFILIFAFLAFTAACANPAPSSGDASMKASFDLAAERAKVEALEAENATLSKEASGLRTGLSEIRAAHASLKADYEALKAAPSDQKSDMIIADLEDRLEEALEANEWLTAEAMALQNDLANAASAQSRPAAPVDMQGFSESEIIADLCYSSSVSSYMVSAVAKALAPSITQERLNAVLAETGNAFDQAHPHTRGPEYVSLTRWTYCTIPYFDEAHHERMRQRAQDRVDALGN